MLRNVSLSYAAMPSPILSFRPQNQALFSILVALIITFVSYQCSAILFDLCFGLKQKGSAKVRDLQIHHLMRVSSPLAVARSLFPVTFAHRTNRTERKASSPHNHAPPTRHPRFQVLVKLFFVLAIAPTVNMITITFTQEFNTRMTVERAGLGGIALGIDNDDRFQSHDALRREEQIPVEAATNDIVHMQFYYILGPLEVDPNVVEVPNTATVEAAALRQSEVTIRINTNVGSAQRTKQVQIKFSEGSEDKNLFTLRHGVERGALVALVNFGVQTMFPWCDVEELSVEELERPAGEAFQQADIYEGRSMVCNIPRSNISRIAAVASRMTDRIAVMPSTQIEIASKRELREAQANHSSLFFEPRTHIFLTRQSPYVSFSILLIILLGTALLRIFVSLVTQNDLATGTELIVRDVLNLPFSDRLLASTNVWVRYSSDPKLIDITR